VNAAFIHHINGVFATDIMFPLHQPPGAGLLEKRADPLRSLGLSLGLSLSYPWDFLGIVRCLPDFLT
jgi:hypothetical protein